MNTAHYSRGDIIFREEEESRYVLEIISGTVEVTKVVGDQSIVLGQVSAGEFVGEMGVIEGRSRGATVRAVSNVSATLRTREEFIQHISTDPNTAFNTILRLSERLHQMDERLVEAAMGRGSRAPEMRPAQPVANGTAVGAGERLTLFAASDDVARALPADGRLVVHFPFHVGRMPAPGEPRPTMAMSLLLEDRQPYRLSRFHFSILRGHEGIVVSDAQSTLGTQVNGEFVGLDFPRLRAPLNPGENLIVAGGDHSPFAFKAVLN